jgi:ribose 5-phosphate isomerase B
MAQVSGFKIALGSDHAGFALKEALEAHLKQQGYDIEDLGTHDTSSCDYPDFALAVGRAVADGRVDRGILVCGTGIGMVMTANKIPGIRAALCHDHYTAVMSRRHNDANVLVLGGRVTGEGPAGEMVQAWLQTPFDGGRHEARVKKIHAAESEGGA